MGVGTEDGEAVGALVETFDGEAEVVATGLGLRLGGAEGLKTVGAVVGLELGLAEGDLVGDLLGNRVGDGAGVVLVQTPYANWQPVPQ